MRRLRKLDSGEGRQAQGLGRRQMTSDLVFGVSGGLPRGRLNTHLELETARWESFMYKWSLR
jgi:hypothetical protein